MLVARPASEVGAITAVKLEDLTVVELDALVAFTGLSMAPTAVR